MLVTALGLGLLTTGCLVTTDPLDSEDLGEPRLETLEPNDTGGGTGTNGLKTSYFHAMKLKLLAATNSRLMPEGSTTEVSSEVNATHLLQSVAGRKTFTYAMKCAGPAGVTLQDINLLTYTGAQLLGTAGAWPTAALAQPAQQDLFACMILHLNPSGTPVNMLVSGEAVGFHPGQDKSPYTFGEAYWTSKVEAGGRLAFYVWPMGDLEDACGGTTGLTGKIWTRFCGAGLSPEECGLHVMDRNDPEHGCTETENGFHQCDGQRALQTRLDPNDVSTLYGGCIL